ncbi:hypothetical protein DVJ77_02480 [Dyella tabacisoli]|uniref:Uncharacterized protein n=1 Tax=Dyella tabacisoli TaxID=2282381 RepID=A0A369UTU0_9GAMM|nr:hypothetical protein DVJ77_02480 [Dyella tabacisoli]
MCGKLCRARVKFMARLDRTPALPYKQGRELTEASFFAHPCLPWRQKQRLGCGLGFIIWGLFFIRSDL